MLTPGKKGTRSKCPIFCKHYIVRNEQSESTSSARVRVVVLPAWSSLTNTSSSAPLSAASSRSSSAAAGRCDSVKKSPDPAPIASSAPALSKYSSNTNFAVWNLPSYHLLEICVHNKQLCESGYRYYILYCRVA